VLNFGLRVDMQSLGLWTSLSVLPLLCALVYLRGRARAAACWAFCWLQATFVALSSWLLYAVWGQPLPGGLPAPPLSPGGAGLIHGNIALCMALLVAPVLWYGYRAWKSRGGSLAHPAA
jgi:hypothetical protein